jgi:acyl dehydratase
LRPDSQRPHRQNRTRLTPRSRFGVPFQPPLGVGGVNSNELEQTSFDDLALGGEWTTRRRTISESEIALFAAVAGDFSPLSVDGSAGSARLAPPALVVAAAIGLGSIDMPIPQVAAWEWVNWRFPKPLKAGETIYARWTLTQKRPPVGHSQTAIAVWRVDVHTTDGALCAEGEVGASVFRRSAPTVDRPAVEAPAAATPRRRRRRRSGAAADSPPPSTPVAAATAAPAVPAQPAAERPPGRSRRRRRRPAGGQAASNGESGKPVPAPEPPLSAPPAKPAPAPTPNTLRRVIGRLRRT